MQALETWVGCSETVSDTITSAPVLALNATLDHTEAPAADVALQEFHDIVYREAQRATDAEPPPQPAPTGAAWQRQIVPDAVLLFRYSALTFNGHRIHYDRKYVTEVEGYPGLIVHGPLIATLLIDLLRRNAPGSEVANFRFKAVRPTFDLHPFQLNGLQEGKTVMLWAQDHEGWLTMGAVATLRQRQRHTTTPQRRGRPPWPPASSTPASSRASSAAMPCATSGATRTALPSTSPSSVRWPSFRRAWG